MERERTYLSEMGLTPAEVVVCLLATAIWRLVDRDGSLWRSAGKGLYQRFETRIRATAYEPTVLDWAWRFATKCHVSPQLIDPRLINAARSMSGEENREGLRAIQQQPGLVVSAVRALQEARKPSRRRYHDDRDDTEQQQPVGAEPDAVDSAEHHGPEPDQSLF